MAVLTSIMFVGGCSPSPDVESVASGTCDDLAGIDPQLSETDHVLVRSTVLHSALTAGRSVSVDAAEVLDEMANRCPDLLAAARAAVLAEWQVTLPEGLDHIESCLDNIGVAGC